MTVATTGSLRAAEYWLTSYRRTWRGSAVSSVITPVLFLTAMGLGLGNYVHGGTGSIDGVRYGVFLAPGLLAAWGMQTAMGETTWPIMGAIKWHRTYHGMLATPLSIDDVLIGHMMFVAFRIVTVCTVFTAVTAVMGLAHSAGILLSLAAAVLTGLAFAAPIAAFAATRENDKGFSMLYRFGMIPLFLFSGTFFPVSQLPGGIRWLAFISPLWHGVALCRGFALGTATLLGTLVHVAVLVALVIGGLLVASRTYHRRLEW
jgi:lipooligosaccharide transport system permease protein